METLVGSLACVDDTFLVKEAQRGNHQAFEELVRCHDRGVLRLALRLTRSESDAQDIYQEAFLRAYTKLEGFRCESRFSTWLYRIVTNLCMEHLRKKHRQNEGSFAPANPSGEEYDLQDTTVADRSADPHVALANRELGLRINFALNKLTPRERLVFELKHCHGIKLRIVGAIIGASEEAAKTSFFRATRKMRAGLADLR